MSVTTKDIKTIESFINEYKEAFTLYNKILGSFVKPFVYEFSFMLWKFDIFEDVVEIIKNKKDNVFNSVMNCILSAFMNIGCKNIKNGYPEIIENDSFHVSSISQDISKNISNGFYDGNNIAEIVEEFMDSKLYSEPEDTSDSPDSGIQERYLKEAVSSYKTEYSPLLGHFMESVTATLLKDNIDNHTSIATDVVNVGVESVLHEVKTKDGNDYDANEKAKKFTELISKDEIITKYIDEYLRNEVKMFYKDITQRYGNIKFLTKINLTHRGIHGEADYVFVLEDNSAILVDCKNYKLVTKEYMTSFLFQLTGYYQQHNIMKLIPKYASEHEYNIKYFMILNPLETHTASFNYYTIDVNKVSSAINVWEDYLSKCLDH